MGFVIGGLWYLAIVGVVLVIGWYVVTQPLKDREIDRWADRFGLTLSDENRAGLTAYLQRHRAIRRCGIFIPFALLLVLNVPANLFVGLQTNWFLDALGAVLSNPTTYLAGYLVGSIVAARRRYPGVVGTGQRAAVLVERRVSDYAPTYMINLGRVAVVLTIVAFILSLIVALPGRKVDGQFVGVAIGVGLLIAFEWTVRSVVKQRQATNDIALIAIDDATRADALHRLARLMCILMLLIGAGAFFGLQGELYHYLPSTERPYFYSSMTNIARTVMLALGAAAFFIWIRDTGLIGPTRNLRDRKTQP